MEVRVSLLNDKVQTYFQLDPGVN